jgi:hypothetical protein
VDNVGVNDKDSDNQRQDGWAGPTKAEEAEESTSEPHGTDDEPIAEGKGRPT